MSMISDLWDIQENARKIAESNPGTSVQSALNQATEAKRQDLAEQMGSAKQVGDLTRPSGMIKETPAQTSAKIADAMSGVTNPANSASKAIQNQYDLYTQNKATQDMINAAQEDVRNAQNQNAIEEIQATNKANQAARTAGASNYAAGNVAGEAGQQSNNIGNYYTNAKNLGTSTQADWLNKQGYAQGQQQEASNLKAGSFLNTLGAIFGGAGTGAQAGMSIGGNR